MDVLSDAIGLMRTGRTHSRYVRLAAPFGRRFPASEAVGFHAVIRGTCWLFAPGNEQVALAPGDIAFLPHGAAHGLADSPSTPLRDSSPSLISLPASDDPGAAPRPEDAAGGATLICGAYAVDRRRIHPVLDGLPGIIHVPAGTAGPRLRSVAGFLHEELEHDRPGNAAMVPALLDVLLLEILRTHLADAAKREHSGWGAALQDPAVSAALRSIHDHPELTWSVAVLATRAGLSRSAFSRRFTALVGQPPLTYLTWWRMALACRLLLDGNAPVAAVARQVGYSSEFAFAHAFKRAHGLSPGRLRAAERGERPGGPGATKSPTLAPAEGR